MDQVLCKLTILISDISLIMCIQFTVGSIEERVVQQKDSYSPNLAAAPAQHQTHQYTSQATKELDDLMASLSDFKVR